MMHGQRNVKAFLA